jgi:hypothetical protein
MPPSRLGELASVASAGSVTNTFWVPELKFILLVFPAEFDRTVSLDSVVPEDV